MTKHNFFSVYDVSWHRKDDEPGYIVYQPKACFNAEKFTITYKDHDYDEITIAEAYEHAREFCRINLGCKFEGDINPATGNRVHRCDSTEAPCTQIIRLEHSPFSLLYKQP